MRQSMRKRARNLPVKNELKSTLRKALSLIETGKLEEAQKFMPYAYSVIDMACKKNLIHGNNADRKKSRIALALNALQKSGGKVAAEK